MTESKRVLAVHRYFWPDTPPYAVMLKRIVQRWNDDGHIVEVIASQPSYKKGQDGKLMGGGEMLDGITIRRLKLPNEVGRPLVRISNALRLAAVIIWKALWNRYDVIMISTVPPVVGGFSAALAAKISGSRFIYHCMDIHPEVGSVSGEFSNPAVYKFLLWLDKWSCKNAEPVVVLSGDMENTLRSRPGGAITRIVVLNNFSLPSSTCRITELPFDKKPDCLTVLFAGNIGRFQGLDVVIEAMSLLKERDDIEFIFMGDGVSRKQLEVDARAMGGHVKFVGHQTVEVAKAAMQSADLGFVSLSAGMYKYAFPSKTMTYLEQGCPLVVSVEPESELARDVVEKGYGIQVPPADPAALADALTKIADDRGVLATMKESAEKKFDQAFMEEKVLHKWSVLLEQDFKSVK